jgi:hypothetical protein
MRCSVCSTSGITEGAHIKKRVTFDQQENHRIFNILPICPTCHYFFDVCKAFTIHSEWKCWIFSDIRQFSTSDGVRFENPFSEFDYAFPPRNHQKKMDNIEVEFIEENQRNEFLVQNNGSAERFFEYLRLKLIKKGRWNYDSNKPKMRTLSTNLHAIDHE